MLRGTVTLCSVYGAQKSKSLIQDDSGNLKITNLDRLIFTKNGEFTI